MATSWQPRLTPLTQPAELSGAGSLVIDKWNETKTYSDTLWATALDALDALKNMVFDVDLSSIPWTDVPLMGLDGIGIVTPTRPTIAPISITWPSFTAVEPTAYVVDIPDITIPAFNVPDPGINIPTAPTVVWPTFTDNQPQLSDIAIPTKPDVAIPPVPQLDFAAIPEPPSYDIPTFDTEAPVADLTPPEPTFVWNEAAYNSDLYDQLTQKIYNELIAGGTGLDPDVEAAIYDRAVARQELDNQQLYDEILNYFSSRGSPLPPGALAGALIEARYKIARNRTDINSDILVNQAKLAQENTHFVITTAVNLEKMGMDYSNAMQNRAFEAAKYTIESTLQVFAMKVETYKARIEIYRVLSEVYRTRIMAEMAKAEVYKAQIEAVKAHTDIQRAYVELYTSQLRGIQVLYEAYRTEMEGANIQANIDRTKMESYMTLVNAYSAKIRAVTARYEAYQTQVAGEVAKAEVYRTQVGAYSAQVGALATAAQIDISKAQVGLTATQAETEVFRTLVQKYTADVSAKAAEIDAMVKEAGLDVDVYRADTALYAAGLDSLSRTYGNRVNEARAKVDSSTAQMDLAARTLIAQYGLVLEASRGIAQVSSQLGASVFAAVSASAHIGHGESRSDSQSQSLVDNYSFTRSENISVSNIHEYIHEV